MLDSYSFTYLYTATPIYLHNTLNLHFEISMHILIYNKTSEINHSHRVVYYTLYTHTYIYILQCTILLQ